MPTFPVLASQQNVRATMPENAFTVDQYADHFQIPYATASKRLAVMVNSGQVKIGKFLCTANGRTCAKNYYVAKSTAKPRDRREATEE